MKMSTTSAAAAAATEAAGDVMGADIPLGLTLAVGIPLSLVFLAVFVGCLVCLCHYIRTSPPVKTDRSPLSPAQPATPSSASMVSSGSSSYRVALNLPASHLLSDNASQISDGKSSSYSVRVHSSSVPRGGSAIGSRLFGHVPVHNGYHKNRPNNLTLQPMRGLQLRSGTITTPLPDNQGFSVNSRGALSGRMTVSGMSPTLQTISGPPHASLIVRDQAGKRVRAGNQQLHVPYGHGKLNGYAPTVLSDITTAPAIQTLSPQTTVYSQGVHYDTIPARTVSTQNGGPKTTWSTAAPGHPGTLEAKGGGLGVAQSPGMPSTGAAPLPPLSSNVTRITLDGTIIRRADDTGAQNKVTGNTDNKDTATMKGNSDHSAKSDSATETLQPSEKKVTFVAPTKSILKNPLMEPATIPTYTEEEEYQGSSLISDFSSSLLSNPGAESGTEVLYAKVSRRAKNSKEYKADDNDGFEWPPPPPPLAPSTSAPPPAVPQAPPPPPPPLPRITSSMFKNPALKT